MPSEYRHEGVPTKRAPISKQSRGIAPQGIRRPPPIANGGCLIKGNQGKNGWIYHVPGMPYYAQTHAEQIFCTEAEARAAGYRRANVR